MDIDEHIALQIRQLRNERGWTLEQLAQASGVSRGMISKIERREASATAALLSRLAASFDVPLSDVIAASPRSRSSVSRKAERARWQDPATGFAREVVSPPMTGSTVEIVEVELPPGARVNYRLDQPATYSQHIIALSDGLRVHLDPAVSLRSGDALYMRPEGEFAFENTATRPCRYLVVMERPRRLP